MSISPENLLAICRKHFPETVKVQFFERADLAQFVRKLQDSPCLDHLVFKFFDTTLEARWVSETLNGLHPNRLQVQDLVQLCRDSPTSSVELQYIDKQALMGLVQAIRKSEFASSFSICFSRNWIKLTFHQEKIDSAKLLDDLVIFP
mgnify:CR=1 FL=1